MVVHNLLQISWKMFYNGHMLVFGFGGVSSQSQRRVHYVHTSQVRKVTDLTEYRKAPFLFVILFWGRSAIIIKVRIFKRELFLVFAWFSLAILSVSAVLVEPCVWFFKEGVEFFYQRKWDDRPRYLTFYFSSRA